MRRPHTCDVRRRDDELVPVVVRKAASRIIESEIREGLDAQIGEVIGDEPRKSSPS